MWTRIAIASAISAAPTTASLTLTLWRHSRASGNPVQRPAWIPAFAGTTRQPPPPGAAGARPPTPPAPAFLSFALLRVGVSPPRAGGPRLGVLRHAPRRRHPAPRGHRPFGS